MNPQDNPFRVRKIQPGALPYLFRGEDSDSRLSDLANRASIQPLSLIVGPHGTGKSTLLHALRPKLTGAFGSVEAIMLRSDVSPRGNFATVKKSLSASQVSAKRNDAASGSTEPGSPARKRLLIIDGIEQLSRRSLFRLLVRSKIRANVFILATSHRSIPGWPVLFRTRAEPETIRELTARLVADVSPTAGGELSHRLRKEDVIGVTDVREFWFRMYDVAADVPDAPLPESA